MKLPQDPKQAVKTLMEASLQRPVLVFKKSPICEISQAAEQELRAWLGSEEIARSVQLAEIDVISERELARGLTAEIGIRHESPQALLFHQGKLVWHGSHGDLSAERFETELRRTKSCSA